MQSIYFVCLFIFLCLWHSLVFSFSNISAMMSYSHCNKNFKIEISIILFALAPAGESKRLNGTYDTNEICTTSTRCCLLRNSNYDTLNLNFVFFSFLSPLLRIFFSGTLLRFSGSLTHSSQLLAGA